LPSNGGDKLGDTSAAVAQYIQMVVTHQARRPWIRSMGRPTTFQEYKQVVRRVRPSELLPVLGSPAPLWDTGSATAATLGGGVQFPGLNLSTQTGFGSSQDMTFHFNVAGKICGNSAEGPLQSSRVDTRNNSG
jgi:hypothetical protein